ncbi:helix-turn-helix domain-containing protein [Leucobacter allii]|uniref:Helix-turn-helix domain-containing protein n=1 Tax=Leucobacter allii TaxID=2932247 RepID=A0ABY4FLT7_9MICO|nr:helix-turn-helix domain-containing protein [Leucobacter allii]UOQ57230.1 helix-turn-helix domain-containing protein [Leucobacter allii]
MSNQPGQIDDARVMELAAAGWSNAAIARELGCHEASVRRARKRLRLASAPALNAGTHAVGESETHRPDGSADYTVPSTVAWGYDDFCKFIRSKGQDPEQVTFSWGVTSTPGGGYFNKLNNVRPKAPQASSIDTDAILDRLRTWTPTPMESVAGEPVGLVVALADLQLGKGEGDGTPGTLRRLEQSLERVVEQIRSLQTRGVRIRSILLANMGDHTEGTHGSYASQPYSVDLNLRDQLQTALEVNLQWVKTLAPFTDNFEYAATICNHGTLSRAGGRENITDDADNATGLITDLIAKICKLHPDLQHVKVNSPRGEMITTTTIEGVTLAMAHGQKITGSEANWLAAQSQNLAHRRKFVPDMWLTAHKHHAQVTDFGPYTRIQATTVEPGSKYFEDLTGQYSRTGVTMFTVGQDLPGKWDNYYIA